MIWRQRISSMEIKFNRQYLLLLELFTIIGLVWPILNIRIMGTMENYICDLESQIQYLKKLLDDNGISYDYEAHLRALQSDVGDIIFPELGP